MVCNPHKSNKFDYGSVLWPIGASFNLVDGINAVNNSSNDCPAGYDTKKLDRMSMKNEVAVV